eukprot:2402846-Pleurochrysis_carterae.AAC.1
MRPVGVVRHGDVVLRSRAKVEALLPENTNRRSALHGVSLRNDSMKSSQPRPTTPASQEHQLATALVARCASEAVAPSSALKTLTPHCPQEAV